MNERATVPASGFACAKGHISKREGDVCALCQPVPAFFDLLEQAWWTEVQGELLPDYDPAVGALALSLLVEARRNVEMTKDAVDQYDGRGQVIEGEVPTEEYARRVAGALSLLFYGGGGEG